MQVSIKYDSIPAQSTNTEPTIWKLELEAKGSQSEIELYAKFLATFSQAGGLKKMEKYQTRGICLVGRSDCEHCTRGTYPNGLRCSKSGRSTPAEASSPFFKSITGSMLIPPFLGVVLPWWREIDG